MDMDFDVDNPFYGFQRSYPTRLRRYHPASPAVRTTPAHKVVSIPVHHVGSERSRLDSAVKIQSVFRGFLVRKSMEKIWEIRNEVNEIEKRILMNETVELIRNDRKERLKVNEMLMSLLLRLDTVRGVDSGVRDCRKAVIKKAIRLQEIVDSIDASEIENRVEDVENLGEIGEENAEQTIETQDSCASNSNTNPLEDDADKKIELQNNDESIPVLDSVTMANEVGDEEIAEEIEDECSASEEESRADSSANPQSLIEGDEDDDDSLTKHETGEIKQSEEDAKDHECGEPESRELLGKMMEDNKKMMGLMTELYERNQMQTRLLESLSHRVEQLERSLMCERLKKKKKKRRNCAVVVVDCSESTQDIKKCGRTL